MQKLFKILLSLLVVIVVIGGLSYVFVFVSKLAQKVAFQGEEIQSRLGQLNDKIDRLQLSVDGLGNSYNGLSDNVVNLERNQGVIKDRVSHLAGDVDEVKLSMTKEMKEITKTVNDLQAQSKQWIKDSVMTMASFESNIDDNNKNIDDIINTRLPALSKEVGGIKDTQQDNQVLMLGIKAKTAGLSVLEGRITDLDKRLAELQEKTLDIILKSDTLRRF